MKIKLVLGIFVALAVASAACAKEESVLVYQTAAARATPVVAGMNFEAGVTVGNHTYLPLNIRGKPSENVQTILQVIDTFEKSYNYLEIVSWQIEAKPDTYSTSPYIYGLWITHRPKR